MDSETTELSNGCGDHIVENTNNCENGKVIQNAVNGGITNTNTESQISTTTQPVNNVIIKTDLLCNCPLRCGEKVTKEKREFLFKEFSALENYSLQNKYLRKYIKVRSINKRLWEDEIIDGKMQRRVTCKYHVPDFTLQINETVSNGNSNDESTSQSVGTNTENLENAKEETTNNNNNNINKNSDRSSSGKLNCSRNGKDENKSSMANGFTDNDACNISTDESSSDSETDESSINFFQRVSATNKKFLMSAEYVEICQKAFINIYGITEKRIRFQRERLIIKSRYLAEKKQKQLEEMERTLSIARNLGEGCQPLFAVLEKTDSVHLSQQILVAIQKDIVLVNNFFQNQLWKPEHIDTSAKNSAQLPLTERLEPNNNNINKKMHFI